LINLVVLTVNALLFCALTFRLWPPALIVAAGVECLIGLIRLSWTIQHQRMGLAQKKALSPDKSPPLGSREDRQRLTET
jgi:hypothetical protein